MGSKVNVEGALKHGLVTESVQGFPKTRPGRANIILQLGTAEGGEVGRGCRRGRRHVQRLCCRSLQRSPENGTRVCVWVGGCARKLSPAPAGTFLVPVPGLCARWTRSSRWRRR